MATLREAAELALKAINRRYLSDWSDDDIAAERALRAALSAEAQLDAWINARAKERAHEQGELE